MADYFMGLQMILLDAWVRATPTGKPSAWEYLMDSIADEENC